MRRPALPRPLLCGVTVGFWIVLWGCGIASVLAAGFPPDDDPSKRAIADEGQAKNVISALEANRETVAPLVTVAVLRFENKGTSVEFNRLGDAIAEMLAHDLGEFPSLRILERTASGVLIQERGLGESKIVGDNKASSDKLTAEYLVTGTSSVSAGKLVVTASLTKVGVDKPQATWQHSGAVDDFIGFEASLVKQVTESLGIKGRPGRKMVPASGELPTLAILSLTNHSPSARLDIMQTGFAEILQSGVGAIEGVRLVDRTEIARILAEQKLSLAGLVDPKTAIQVGQLLKADRLLVGSFLEIGSNLGIHVRIVDASSGMVVATERVSGPRDNFSQLLEDLILRIVRDLARKPTSDDNALVHAAMPARSLEVAIHLATGERMAAEKNHPQAIQAFQQALLLEPGNIASSIRLMDLTEDNAEKWRIGHQALSQKEFETAHWRQKSELLWDLTYAYTKRNPYSELERVGELIVKNRPKSKDRVTILLGSALLKLNRVEEGNRLLESVESTEVDPASDWKDPGLKSLYWHYLTTSSLSGIPKEKRTSERSRAACLKVIAIVERILVSAKGKTDRDAEEWAQMIIPGFVDFMSCYDERGDYNLYFPLAERADVMQRVVDVFEWYPAARAKGYFSIAMNAELAGQWDQALAAYQKCLHTVPELENAVGWHQGTIPDLTDYQLKDPTKAIDQKIEAHYRIAKITEEGLQQPERAAEAYQEMIREVGLTHFRGPEVVSALAKMNLKPQYPEKCALLWGGDYMRQRSWNRVLAPAGYQVHSVRTSVITLAKLAPYSLVILARTSQISYSPSEILALRSYVATGGSLLTIVSPGWEAASPSTQSSLLGFFDIQVGARLPSRTTATHIDMHPITSGITSVMAKSAVALRGAPRKTLIAEGDNGLLLASEYRFGRVVVAGFGQWFLPDPSVYVNGWGKCRGFWIKTPAADLPVEDGDGLCRPLLDNVVRWLGERPARSPEFTKWKEDLAAANWSAWRVHANESPSKEMAAPCQKLIASAPDALTREESLWIAGEAQFQVRAGPTTLHLRLPDFPSDLAPSSQPELRPEPYQQLLAQFPESPLLHYAQWRLADCGRATARIRNGWGTWDRASTMQLVEAFNKVSAPHGTHPWAWTRLRQGALNIHMHDFAAAIIPLKEVADTMPNGPERTLALQMLMTSLKESGQKADAGRINEELKAAPTTIYWDRYADWLSEWIPVRP